MAQDDLSVSYLTNEVSYLTNEARTVLSRLNSRRLISSDGPGNLPRDYRGLAFCINVTSQELENAHRNKIDWLLETWHRRHDGRSTIHQLLLFLEQIDRYDIRDDLLALGRTNGLVRTDGAWTAQNQVAVVSEPEQDDLVTIEDVEEGAPVLYDALVLFAEADRDFIATMINKMETEYGFRLCTKHSLRPGMMQFRPMTELIRDRCRFVILVYSPDFFISPDEKFFMDYVHAWNIGNNGSRLIPCMYRSCQLPPHYSFYHNLFYNSVAYDFWAHLGKFLNTGRTSRITASASPPLPAQRLPQIREGSRSNGHLSNGHSANAYQVQEPTTQTVTLPDVPSDSLSQSTTMLSTTDTRPLQTVSLNDISKIKKKNSITTLLKKPFRVFQRNNKSKKILVSN